MGESIDLFLKRTNIEYEAKRKSGRVKSPIVTTLRPGTYELFKRKMIDSGQIEGQFKIVALQYESALTFNFEEYSLAKMPGAKSESVNA
jgi:hypothetical protein